MTLWYVAFVLAIFLWLGGYFMTARFMSTTGSPPTELEKIISPPKWLYYLCGAPVSKDYPKGTMRVSAFRSQMFGIFLVIFLVWSFISKASTSANVVGFACSAFFTYVVTSYISKHYGFKHQSKSQKKRK
jgi:hypothetical protein